MSKPIHPDDGSKCPLWRAKRAKVCHTCAWYNLVRGKHPQSGADVDRWDCAIALMPMLQIEGAMVGRQTTATLDALRNEVAQSHDTAMVGGIARLNARLEDATRVAELPVQKLLNGGGG